MSRLSSIEPFASDRTVYEDRIDVLFLAIPCFALNA
jgi:hypothetical protein